MLTKPSVIVSFLADRDSSSVACPLLLLASDSQSLVPVAMTGAGTPPSTGSAIPSGLATGDGARPAERLGRDFELAVRGGPTSWNAAELALQVGRSASTISRAEDQLEAALAQAGIEPSDVLKRARDVYSMHGVVVDAVALLHAAADEDWAAVSTLLETLGVPATRATLTAAEHWTPLAREAVHEALTDAKLGNAFGRQTPTTRSRHLHRRTVAMTPLRS